MSKKKGNIIIEGVQALVEKGKNKIINQHLNIIGIMATKCPIIADNSPLQKNKDVLCNHPGSRKVYLQLRFQLKIAKEQHQQQSSTNGLQSQVPETIQKLRDKT